MAQAQAYSPTESTPYQAYQPPEPAPAPPPTQLTQQQPYQFTGAPTTHLGAAAGLLDNIFRGYMRGKEEGQAKQVMQMKAKSDNLRNSYDQDARLWLQMKASGVDPNSPEFKKATSAVQGSWDAMQEWLGKHVDPQDDGTKKKKGKKTDQPSDPLTDLRSSDPAVKARALFQLRQKMGPTVFWQGKQYDTPEAQAQRKTGELATQNTLTSEQALSTRNRILAIPEDQRTEKDTKDMQAADEILTPPQAKGNWQMISGKGPDGKPMTVSYDRNRGVAIDDYGNVVHGFVADAKGAAKLFRYKDGTLHYDVPGSEPDGATPDSLGSQPKIGSLGDLTERFFGKNPTAQQELWAKAQWNQMGAGTTTGTHVVMVPQKDGTIVPVTVETTSTKSFPKAGGPPPGPTPAQAAPGAAPASGNQPPGAQPPPQAAPGTSPSQTPPAHHAAPHPAAAPPAHHQVPGVVGVGEPVGGHETPTESAAHKKYTDAVGLSSFADKVRASDNPTEQRELAVNMARTMAGRFNMKEYDLVVKNAGIANSFEQWMNDTTTGKLTPKIMHNLIKTAHDYKDAMYDEYESIKTENEGKSDKGDKPEDKPSPQTHKFSVSAWSKANPSGRDKNGNDLETVKKAAKDAHYLVVN